MGLDSFSCWDFLENKSVFLLNIYTFCTAEWLRGELPAIGANIIFFKNGCCVWHNTWERQKQMCMQYIYQYARVCVCVHAWNGYTENWWKLLGPYLVYRLQLTTCMVSHQRGLRGYGHWCQSVDPGSKHPAAQPYNTLWPSAVSLVADSLHRETLRIPPCWGQTGGKKTKTKQRYRDDSSGTITNKMTKMKFNS